MADAKKLLNEYNLNKVSSKNTKLNIHSLRVIDLFNIYLPIYKKIKMVDAYKGLQITDPLKCKEYEDFEKLIDNNKFRLSSYIIFKSNLKDILPLIGHIKITDYDIDCNNALIEHFTKNNLSDNSTRIRFVELKRLFVYGKEKGYLSLLPNFPKIKTYKPSEMNVKDIYSKKDIEILLTHANEDQSFLLHIYLETGMRPEEGAFLSLDINSKAYCNLEDNTITIKSSRHNKRGRIIPLSKKLNQLIRNRLVLNKINGYQLNPYSINNSNHSPTMYQGKAFARLCKRCGMADIHEKNNLRMLRATVITQLSKKGVSERLQNHLFGNKESIRNDHYTGTLIDEQREALDS